MFIKENNRDIIIIANRIDNPSFMDSIKSPFWLNYRYINNNYELFGWEKGIHTFLYINRRI